MIRQKVILKKLKTLDGHFDFENQKGVPVGTPFWIDVLSFRVMNYRRRPTAAMDDKSSLMFSALVVKTADEGVYVPVEVLQFTDDFEVTR